MDTMAASEIPSLPEATMENPRPAVLKRLEPVVGDMYDARVPLDPSIKVTTLKDLMALGKGEDDATTAASSRRSSVFEAVSTSMKLQGWSPMAAAPQNEAKTTTTDQEQTVTPASPMIPGGRVIPVCQITQNYFRKTVRPDASLLGGERPKKSTILTWLFASLFSRLPAETLPIFRKPAATSLATPLLTQEEGLLSDVTASAVEQAPESKKKDSNENPLLALVCILIMAALCNIDHGALPAVVSDIQEQFKDMSYLHQTLLGSLVYMGVLAGTFFATVCTPSSADDNIGVKWLLVASLLSSSAAAYGFACAKSLTFMGLTRFLMGFFQAIPVFYLPIWVEALAPEGRKTRWIIYSQLGGIAGSVIGYFLGGVFSPRYHDGARLFVLGSEISWRTPFLVQSLLLLPLVAFLIWLVPSKLIEIHSLSFPPTPSDDNAGTPGNEYELQEEGSATMSSFSSSTSDDPPPTLTRFGLPEGFFSRLSKHLRRSASNFTRRPFYLVMTLGMSLVYFVLTGIQYWVTEYMVHVLHFDRMPVVLLSSFCFLTAPITGVWCGGALCGEREGDRPYSTVVRSATLLAGLASMLAVASAYVSNVVLFSVLLWGTLFYGGSLIPLGTQLLLPYTPRQEDLILPVTIPTPTRISLFSYNVLGWFAAPVVIGGLMDTINTWQDAGHLIGAGHRKDLALSAGFTLIVCLSIVIFGFFGAANFMTRVPSPEELTKHQQEDFDQEVAREVKKIPLSIFLAYQLSHPIPN
ncbi:major facilitator family protein [Cystoisospora suis]|uniref:Major facilitator family protein n=1 Tax=Cystoisospora suis TaxID=483139 RepID=A0A2C6KMR0_9APIC|nr:major facilitator family protein [Cystoisospora suis]